MPWKETKALKERTKFILAWENGELSMAELCRDFGISRQTGYKWVRRYREMGCDLNALHDRSRAPNRHPSRTDQETIDLIVSVRKARPTWGPRKLLIALRQRYPDHPLPSASTIGAILKRKGLSRRRHRRRRTPPSHATHDRGDRPNAVWCTDFKGHFSTTDGSVCYPLTLMDEYSRFLIRCEGLLSTSAEEAIPIFDSAFEEFGLPDVIRSDNGPPFASRGPGGLTRLSVWWTKLGIEHARIEPGHPEQNGRHERMHKTLKEDTASPPRSSLRAQQRAFDDFRRIYNEERPHESLDDRAPSDVYLASQKTYEEFDPRVEYPFGHEIVNVTGSGRAIWSGGTVTVGKALAHEQVLFEPTEDGRWEVFFGEMSLGLFNPARMKPKLVPRRTRWRSEGPQARR